MKLSNFKNLPGAGDPSTWGGRTPVIDDEQEDALANYFRTDDDELNNIFIVDPGKFDINDTTVEEQLKKAGYQITNDTGHSFFAAFAHAQKPVHNFFCGPEDNYVSMYVVAELKRIAQDAGKKFTIIELQQLNKKWMQALLSQQP